MVPSCCDIGECDSIMVLLHLLFLVNGVAQVWIIFLRKRIIQGKTLFHQLGKTLAMSALKSANAAKKCYLTIATFGLNTLSHIIQQCHSTLDQVVVS